MDEEWDKYCEWTYEEFFSGIPIGSNVIEIGPAFGFHTKLIQRQKPNHHRCIEPNVLMKEALEELGAEVILDQSAGGQLLLNGTDGSSTNAGGYIDFEDLTISYIYLKLELSKSSLSICLL